MKSLNLETNSDLYKGLYEGLIDKNKFEELRQGKITSERNKYYDVVK